MLVEALFDAFGASRRGAVTLEEFICAVAVMHTGNAPEQLRMLFEVCSTVAPFEARDYWVTAVGFECFPVGQCGGAESLILHVLQRVLGVFRVFVVKLSFVSRNTYLSSAMWHGIARYGTNMVFRCARCTTSEGRGTSKSIACGDYSTPSTGGTTREKSIMH